MYDTRNGGLPAFGRLLMAAIFVMGGANKLFDPAALAGAVAAKGLPFPMVGAWVAIATELVGGVMVLVGWQTRIAALWLATWCVATAAIYHYVPGDQNMMIHFWKNIAMTGGFLQIAAYGAGAWSLDSLLARRRGSVLQAAE